MTYRAFKRLMALIMLTALFAAALTTEFATPVAAQSEITVTVKVDKLNLRSLPNSRAPLVTTLGFGANLKLTGRNTEATWAFGTADSGASGWAAVNYLVFPSGAKLKNLPIVNIEAPAGSPPGGGTDPTPAGGPGVSAPPPPAVSGTLTGGFEIGGQVQGLGGVTVDAMHRAGMTWVKRQAREGDGGAVGAIGEAHALGFHILLSVVGDKNSVTDPGYHDRYAAYVGGLAGAGADAIEVWNEENLDREWKEGSIDPALYVQLLAKSYNAIKAANRNTIVITGAPSPTGAEGAYGLGKVWNDDRYVAGLAAAGAGRYADCIGVHYNEGIVSPTRRSGDPRGDNYPTRYFDTMLSRGLTGFRGKKACFTELGFLSPEGYGPLPGNFGWAGNVTVAQQSQWLAEAALRAARSGRVRLMIIFNVDFNYYGSDDPQAGYAMIRPGGNCPACDSLGNLRR